MASGSDKKEWDHGKKANKIWKCFFFECFWFQRTIEITAPSHRLDCLVACSHVARSSWPSVWMRRSGRPPVYGFPVQSRDKAAQKWLEEKNGIESEYRDQSNFGQSSSFWDYNHYFLKNNQLRKCTTIQAKLQTVAFFSEVAADLTASRKHAAWLGKVVSTRWIKRHGKQALRGRFLESLYIHIYMCHLHSYILVYLLHMISMSIKILIDDVLHRHQCMELKRTSNYFQDSSQKDGIAAQTLAVSSNPRSYFPQVVLFADRKLLSWRSSKIRGSSQKNDPASLLIRLISLEMKVFKQIHQSYQVVSTNANTS